MNKYNPNIHHRRSIRLKGYDYSQAGLYFVTICVQDRACLFGEIDIKKGEHVGADLRVCPDIQPNAIMVLNDAGKMVEKWYYELKKKFPDIECHEMVVMPNHFHCIVENVGADLRVCPDNAASPNYITNQNDITNQNVIANQNDIANQNVIANQNDMAIGNNTEGEHVGSPLHRVVQWFKTMTTNEYIRGVKTLGWQPFNGKLWQRNYYEHIIRNEQSYQTISEYIINNPAKWKDDKFYRE